jgi:hypothetical protein
MSSKAADDLGETASNPSQLDEHDDDDDDESNEDDPSRLSEEELLDILRERVGVDKIVPGYNYNMMNFSFVSNDENSDSDDLDDEEDEEDEEDEDYYSRRRSRRLRRWTHDRRRRPKWTAEDVRKVVSEFCGKKSALEERYRQLSRSESWSLLDFVCVPFEDGVWVPIPWETSVNVFVDVVMKVCDLPDALFYPHWG